MLGNTALPTATGAGEGLAAVAFGGCAVGGDGAPEGVGSAVASAPHCALRKSFHFMPPRVPASFAALYLALHSFIDRASAALSMNTYGNEKRTYRYNNLTEDHGTGFLVLRPSPLDQNHSTKSDTVGHTSAMVTTLPLAASRRVGKEAHCHLRRH